MQKICPTKWRKVLLNFPICLCVPEIRPEDTGVGTRSITYLCIYKLNIILKDVCGKGIQIHIHMDNNITRVGVNWYYNPQDFSTCPAQVCRILEQCIKQTLDKNNKNSCNNIWSIPFNILSKNFFLRLEKINGANLILYFYGVTIALSVSGPVVY